MKLFELKMKVRDLPKDPLYSEIRELNLNATAAIKNKDFAEAITLLTKAKPLMIRNNDQFTRFLRLPNTLQKAGRYLEAKAEMSSLVNVIDILASQYDHQNNPESLNQAVREAIKAQYRCELHEKMIQLAKREKEFEEADYLQDELEALQQINKDRSNVCDELRAAYKDGKKQILEQRRETRKKRKLIESQNIINKKSKSRIISFLLTAPFGCFGLFYAEPYVATILSAATVYYGIYEEHYWVILATWIFGISYGDYIAQESQKT